MSECTLDDLVPNTRCNRITLEPLEKIATNAEGDEYYLDIESSYKVSFDISIYDTLEGEKDVINYFLSDSVTKYMKLKMIYCRNRGLDEILSFLRVNGRFSESEASFIIDLITDSIEPLRVLQEHIPTGQIVSKFRQWRDESPGANTFSTASMLFNNPFLYKLADMCRILLDEDQISISTFDFTGFSEGQLRELSARTQDDDGNAIYDLKIPREYITFSNSLHTKDCYLHLISSYNFLQAFEDGGITIETFDKSMINFGYNGVDVCNVLSGGEIASDKVQDFRLVERVAEIIQSDRISDYDAHINSIAALTGDADAASTDICSDLFISYMRTSRTSKNFYINGIYYFNIINFLKRNSKCPMVYNNILTKADGTPRTTPLISAAHTDNLFSSDNILNIRAERIRTDVPLESQKMEVITRFPKIATSEVGLFCYTFNDWNIRKKSSGTYSYSIKIKIKDALEDLVETLAKDCNYLRGELHACINLLHNNSNYYNELRDTISNTGKGAISTILNVVDVRAAFDSFKTLFALFVGEKYDLVATTLANLNVVKKDRRMIENLDRIIGNLLFEVEKYYSTKNLDDSALTSIKPSSVMEYNKSWKKTIDKDAGANGMLTFINKSDFIGRVLPWNKFVARMKAEGDRWYDDLPPRISWKLGFLTPSFLDAVRLDAEDAKVLVKIFKSMFGADLAIPKAKSMDMSVLTNNQNHNLTKKELRRNAGVFESFAHDLGISVTNKTIFPDMSPFELKRRQGQLAGAVLGIDVGTNISDVVADTPDGSYPYTEELSANDEDANANLDLDKETLMAEHAKKEKLIADIMIARQGYSMLDRKSFTQGLKSPSKYHHHIALGNKASVKLKRFVPKLIDSANQILIQAVHGEGNELYASIFSRYVLDNIHIIYYLDSWNENLNPIWAPLVNKQVLINRKIPLFCKIERFASGDLGIGAGNLSKKEILSKYFYLIGKL